MGYSIRRLYVYIFTVPSLSKALNGNGGLYDIVLACE